MAAAEAVAAEAKIEAVSAFRRQCTFLRRRLLLLLLLKSSSSSSSNRLRAFPCGQGPRRWSWCPSGRGARAWSRRSGRALGLSGTLEWVDETEEERRRKNGGGKLTLFPKNQTNKTNSSSDFSDQIFFHVSEVLKDGETREGEEQQQQQQQSNRGQKRQQQQQPRDIAALVAPGTEVEFTVGARGGRQSALQVKTLPPGSLDPYNVSKERLVGVVERELRGGGGSGPSRRGGGGGGGAGAAGYGGRLVLAPPTGGTGGGEGHPESLAFDAEDLALMGVHDASLASAGTGAVGFGPPPYDPGPRQGETVEFSLATDKKTGERRATLVARRRERGLVVHTKRSNEGQGGLFGFIRPIDRRNSEQHVYFHESQVVATTPTTLTPATGDLSLLEPIKPGDEVTMVVAVLDAAAGRASALAVQVHPPGTFPDFVAIPGCERVEGRVVAGGGGRGGASGAGEGALSIAYIDEETGAEARVLWKAGAKKENRGGKTKSGDGDEEGTGSSDDNGDAAAAAAAAADDDDDEASAAADANPAAAANSSSSSSPASGDSPAVDDDVVFTLARSARRLGGGRDPEEDRRQALAVELVRRGSDRRELGAISALKGSYGLIKCCDRPGTVLFRYEEFAEGEEGAPPSSSSSSSTAAPAADAAAAAAAAADDGARRLSPLTPVAGSVAVSCSSSVVIRGPARGVQPGPDGARGPGRRGCRCRGRRRGDGEVGAVFFLGFWFEVERDEGGEGV